MIIAYKELRKLEMEIIDALNATGAQSVIYYSGIRLSQFFGIEIDDFAHEIGILALWLAEHQMNSAFKTKFGYAEAALPLRDSGNIVVGNSLRLDWEKVCSREDEQGIPYEVYVCGNPPFSGHISRSESQVEDMALNFDDNRAFKKLDYVATWFVKGSKYIDGKKHVNLAFVATNSIVQGLQVSYLWPILYKINVEICFAYTTFSWKNHARDNAAVHVVIIGLSVKSSNKKWLYTHVDNKTHKETVSLIGPYLTANEVIVNSSSYPITDVSPMSFGSMPNDGGHLLMTASEMQDFVSKEPQSKHFIRKILGAQEFLNHKERYCLWLKGYQLEDLKQYPLVWDRVLKVKETRLNSKSEGARKSAVTPHLFWFTSQPDSGNYILVPRVSSERRPYVPIGFLDSSVVSTDANQIIPNGTLYEFGVLTSETHNDWMRTVGGRLKSDYRYSTSLVYNTFPWPEASELQRKAIEALAEEVLLVREDYPGKTLAELYDPEKMPQPLLDAHEALDRSVEKLYRDKPFKDALERLQHLFTRYEKLIAAEQSKAPAKKTAKRTKQS